MLNGMDILSQAAKKLDWMLYRNLPASIMHRILTSKRCSVAYQGELLRMEPTVAGWAKAKKVFHPIRAILV